MLKNRAKFLSPGILIAILFSTMLQAQEMVPTKDDGKFCFVPFELVSSLGKHHTKHLATFGAYTSGYNYYFLEGIDKVQSTAPDGGGYFIGLKVTPPESPIGYDLRLGSRELIKAPRTTSYCSGSSYSAFIEGLNSMIGELANIIPDQQFEAMRMQEKDGGRREDFVKMWGIWNADGPGSEYALVQYTGAGRRVEPNEARPGDFCNISWKKGLGHSVVFLGFTIDTTNNKKYLLYWSSQKSTNGLADSLAPLDDIESVLFVRFTKPENIFTFNPDKKINKNVRGSVINLK